MGSVKHRPPQLFTIESSDRDELSAYFSERISKVTVSPASPSRDVSISAAVVPLGPTVAFQIDMPAGARFRQAEDLDGIFVFLPTRGEKAVWTRGAKEIVCGPTTGYVGPMLEKDTAECPGPWGHMALKISSEQITRNLSNLLDQPVVGPLAFDPEINLETKAAKTLASMMRLALAPIDGEALLSSSPLAAAQFSESLTLLLLESLRHNYSDALSADTYSLKPKHVKRAIDYMRANARQPLTLQDIAAAAQVSIRALHYGFQKFVGESPFEHLRQIRLEAAYAELVQAPETVSIADIAKRWGFPNPGRFAQICKASYGRSPSEIRRARPGRPRDC
ncbi:MAG: AraC family transcriptional regulator [Rhizobiales bacterium]|nr:AraC family transcriptional regulator [Hyphomicrobiales bacterium]